MPKQKEHTIMNYLLKPLEWIASAVIWVYMKLPGKKF